MIGGPSRNESNAPVIHAHSTPPSYSSRGGPNHGAAPRYNDHPSSRSGSGGAPNYTASTPPHGPSSYHHHGGRNHHPVTVGTPPTATTTVGPRSSVVPMASFPNKRVKISSRHSLHPLSLDLNKRANSAGGDFFTLLRAFAPAFGGFRFKLPEMMEDGKSPNDPTGNGSSSITVNIVREASNPGGEGPRPNELQMSIAKRRIDSSLCAFGGSLPPRTVSPSPSNASISSSSGPVVANMSVAAAVTGSAVNNHHHSSLKKSSLSREETPEEKEERQEYQDSLANRYFMKEQCISWDVECHEVIAPKVSAGKTGRGRNKGSRAVASTPKTTMVKGLKNDPLSGKFCAPVTPSTPNSPPGNGVPTTPGAAGGNNNPPSTPKGSKIKYRCKLCGQPKQNHVCTYKQSLVRSIGTMVYPAVNAFVSNEPGRLAPALSEMNNFTSLLSQDASSAPHQVVGSLGPSSSMASGYHPMPPRGHPYGPPRIGHPGGPYGMLTPDTSHWSPNTPGGLSTMSSSDPNSPGAPPSSAGVGGISPHLGHNNFRKRDHNHLMMSRTMSGLHRPPPAPAGAIPSDVLFRDTMELQREQFRTVRVGSSSSSVDGSTSSAVSDTGGANNPMDGPNAYRYPSIPTPYAQRKEMGDTLFALSREVPKLADSCAAILRDARENDMWDQAMAELTTQVLVVLKCEETDYTLEGLRRHLLTLGIAS